MAKGYVWVLAGAFGLMLTACGGGGKDAPAQGDKGGSGASKTESMSGVPECDEYIEKYTACIEKHVPAAMQSALKQGMEQSRQAWKQAKTASPEARAHMASACKQALSAAKQATQSYGCSW